MAVLVCTPGTERDAANARPVPTRVLKFTVLVDGKHCAALGLIGAVKPGANCTFGTLRPGLCCGGNLGLARSPSRAELMSVRRKASASPRSSASAALAVPAT